MTKTQPEVMDVEESELQDSPSSALAAPPPESVAISSASAHPSAHSAQVSQPPSLPPAASRAPAPAGFVEFCRWGCLGFDGLMVALLVWLAIAVPLHIQAMPDDARGMIAPMAFGSVLLAAAIALVAWGLQQRKRWAWTPQLILMLLVAVPIAQVLAGLAS